MCSLISAVRLPLRNMDRVITPRTFLQTQLSKAPDRRGHEGLRRGPFVQVSLWWNLLKMRAVPESRDHPRPWMARVRLGADRKWLFAGRPWQSLFWPQRAQQCPPR